MGLITLIKELSQRPPRELDFHLSTEQIASIRKGYVVWVLEKKEFQPHIFAIGLREGADIENIKDDDIILRDITNALIMANYDLEAVREELKKGITNG